MIRRILLSLAAGDDGARAVQLTRVLSERGGCRVMLLRMEEWPVSGPGIAYGWTASMRTGHLTAVRESLTGSQQDGVSVLSPEALSSDGVLKKAETGKASLIILPYHQEGLWARLLHGGGAQRILWDSTIPVLAVPEGEDLPPAEVRRILYVHPGGEAAMQGSRIAISMAQMFEAPVDLLQAGAPAPPRQGILSGWLFGETKPASAPKERSGEDGLLELFRRRDVEARRASSTGGPLAAVDAAVRDQGADLVVLTHAVGADRTADAVARHVLDTLRLPLLLWRERPASDLPDDAPRFRLRV